MAEVLGIPWFIPDVNRPSGLALPEATGEARGPSRAGSRRGPGSRVRVRNMNDTYRELKVRLRQVDAVLEARGTGNLELAQAVSRAKRLARRGDRSREPSVELRHLLEDAERLARLGV